MGVYKRSEARKTCGDCGVLEGEIHHWGCDVEICPYCGGQMMDCGCFKGKTNEEIETDPNRIPWVEIPLLCASCGELYPDMFHDGDWRKYVPPPLQKKILCRRCYERVKELFPKGWRKAPRPERRKR